MEATLPEAASGQLLTPCPPAELGEASGRGYSIVFRQPPDPGSFSPSSSLCLLLGISFACPFSSQREAAFGSFTSSVPVPSFAGVLAPDSALIHSCAAHCSKVVTHVAR